MLAIQALDCAWQAVQSGGWSDERLAALQKEWEQADFLTNLSEATACDRADALDYSERLMQQQPFVDFSLTGLLFGAAHQPTSYTWREFKNDIGLVRFRNEVYVDNLRIFVSLWKREGELRQAIQVPTWADMRRVPGVTNLPQVDFAYGPLADEMKSIRKRESRALIAVVDGERRRRVAVTAIALERYRGRHGRYPQTLDQLAPELLKAPLRDFTDGQPLRYRLTEDGHFVLYSVGRDGVDNGGQALSQQSVPVLTTNMIVWPRPFTSEK